MSDIDGFTLLAIALRAVGYGAGLLAAGSALFLFAYGRRIEPGSAPSAAGDIGRRTAWLGGIATLFAVVVTLAGVGALAGRLSGNGAVGMLDLLILQIVWEGPVGTAVTVRLAGLAAIGAGLWAHRRPAGRAVMGLGALVFAYSFTFVGHSVEAPRWLLASVLTLHLLAASFWVGAFAPLCAAARHLAARDAAALLEAFGRAAVWVVGVLVAAGLTFAAVLLKTPVNLLQSDYGRILLVKLALVAALLGLAALNKLRLVPALAAGEESARGRLTRSIALEAAAFAAILCATAVLTSVATPPPAVSMPSP